MVDDGVHVVRGAQACFEGGDAIADPVIINRGERCAVCKLGWASSVVIHRRSTINPSTHIVRGGVVVLLARDSVGDLGVVDFVVVGQQFYQACDTNFTVFGMHADTGQFIELDGTEAVNSGLALGDIGCE